MLSYLAVYNESRLSSWLCLNAHSLSSYLFSPSFKFPSLSIAALVGLLPRLAIIKYWTNFLLKLILSHTHQIFTPFLLSSAEPDKPQRGHGLRKTGGLTAAIFSVQRPGESCWFVQSGGIIFPHKSRVWSLCSHEWQTALALGRCSGSAFSPQTWRLLLKGPSTLLHISGLILSAGKTRTVG